MKKQEYNYFDEFIENTKYIVESAQILKETLLDYSKEKLELYVQKVHELENKADNRLHNMRNYLIKDFLPPIDREDIILIGHRIDDLEDYIDEIMINFNILNINEIREDILEFTEILVNCCSYLQKTLEKFKNLKKIENIKENVIEINNLEEKGDRLFEKAMTKLYRENCNSVDIIKWTTIYNCFENTIDACEKIADEIEDVVMKNS